MFLPGESHGQRYLAGYRPWGRKESDTTEWLSMHTLITQLAFFVKARIYLFAHMGDSHTFSLWRSKYIIFPLTCTHSIIPSWSSFIINLLLVLSLPCFYSLSWECVTAAIQSYCSKPLLLYLSSWIPVLTKQQCAKPKSQSLRSDWWSQLWPSRKPSTYPVDQYRGPTAQVSVHRLFSLKKEVF